MVVEDYYTLNWFHDQNHGLPSSGIGIRTNNNYYILDEIVLRDCDVYSVLEAFFQKYNNHKNRDILIWGDSYG
jgi:hypothetical protein